MYFWTTQKNDVLDIILKEKLYEPNFTLSNGLGGNGMKPAYNELLKKYNSKNQTTALGLVFGLTQLEDSPIESIQQFRNYFSVNDTFMSSVTSESNDYAVLKLKVSNQYDLLPIYFQDFIILGMRCENDMSFSEYVKSELANLPIYGFNKDFEIAQTHGWTQDFLLNKITQSHIHNISINDIIEIHSCYNFNENAEIPLSSTAIKLKTAISSIQTPPSSN